MLQEEIKQFIISTLSLEDIKPEDIDDNAPLFGEGLGLDSIDAIELGVGLFKKYGINIDSGSEGIKEHFASVNSLVKLIESHK